MVPRIKPDFNRASEWVPTRMKRLDQLPAAYADYADTAGLEQMGCGALTIGTVPDPEVFSGPAPQEEFVIDFTMIKRARDEVYYIPREFAQYENTIRAVAEDQDVRSTNSFNKFAFLFLHRSVVQAGHHQRNSDWHRDALPDNIARYYMCGNDEPCNIYMVSDTSPTVVQSEPVKKAQAVFKNGLPEEAAAHSRQLDPYEIALINDYVYHRGVLVKEACLRTFMVVMYAPMNTRPRPMPGL